MNDEDNRSKLKTLLEKHSLTQARGASLICAQTQRPCSVRAIRSWLASPEKPSARSCPDWALKALINAIPVSAKSQDGNENHD